METPQLFLDLDSTTFNTKEFFIATHTLIERQFGIPSERWMAEYTNFNVYNDEMHHYDLPAHLASYGLVFDEVQAYLQQKIEPNNLVFPDVPRLLERAQDAGYQTSVLTYGQAVTQLAKLACVPLLESLPRHIVLESKGPYLQRVAREVTGFMIDDKEVRDLPTGITFIHIDRYSETLPQGTIRSLDEVSL